MIDKVWGVNLDEIFFLQKPWWDYTPYIEFLHAFSWLLERGRKSGPLPSFTNWKKTINEGKITINLSNQPYEVLVWSPFPQI